MDDGGDAALGHLNEGPLDFPAGGFERHEAPETPAAVAAERYEQVQQVNAFDEGMGFYTYDEGPARLGWLVNMQDTLVQENEKDAGKSGIHLYFIDDAGAYFKSTIVYQPYFYLVCRPGTEAMVEACIKKRFDTLCVSTERQVREDLKLANHLIGQKREVIKLTFTNMQDFYNVRKPLMKAASVNSAKGADSHQAAYDYYDELIDKNEIAYEGHLAVHQQHRAAAKRSYQDPLECILELREYDLMYYVRCAIDLDLRVGTWYEVSVRGGAIALRPRRDIVKRADPVVLAWDIETTKLPLKFPDAAFDVIMMISYMIDGQGFLITNRQVVSQDIDDFEYTPKPEYEGPFTIFNEADETALLQRFFAHIRTVRPTVFVTYNGDFFDWPFVEARATTLGLDFKGQLGFAKDANGEYKSSSSIHMDCFAWVKRDSYLPQGSQGLKAVTTAKLGYNPIEVDPEDMTRFASEQPQMLAQYSVSDAVATYYLYMKYVHPFIFSLCNIIPMAPDDVLRRGSGTLCEALLMIEAYEANILMPNKHTDPASRYFDGHLLETETYVGGHVEALEAGVFRSDLPTQFHVAPAACQQLIDELDRALAFTITVESQTALDEIANYDEVHAQIKAALEDMRDRPSRSEAPLIYHLDVAAMYPNIILTNRLQPDAMVDEADCASCDYNRPGAPCKRKLPWSWRGEYFPPKRDEINMLRNQLEHETFQVRTRDDRGFLTKTWQQLGPHDQAARLKARISDYSRKVYHRLHETQIVAKQSTVCQRENPFYVNTVRNFRDRRYEYKGLHKTWKKKLDSALAAKDLAAAEEARKLIVVYDSLQLAHKCILNSFYGYVMRKGARWYSMEMAGIVCLMGATIIQLARQRVEQLGRPLELDTDGIWCILPQSFPENFSFKLKSGKSLSISYPCVMLNHLVHDQFTNHQYGEEVVDPQTGAANWAFRSENSIFFEVDGPYRAMILPSSTEEDKLLKKRYAVFNDDGSLAELKGFEIKRRGELKLIKIFQGQIFQRFLEGTTLETCYQAVADVANRWLDILYSRGADLGEDELFELIGENRSMSKSLLEYGAQKSTSITTAKRLAEFLGEAMVRDRGINCHFVISHKPAGIPVSERAVPVAIFQAEPAVKRHFLRKWLRDVALPDDVALKDVLDWQYYLDRFASTIQRLITIPAAMQKVSNPVPRVQHPAWLHRRVQTQEATAKQTKISDMFARVVKPARAPAEVADLEDAFVPHAHPMSGGRHGAVAVVSSKRKATGRHLTAAGEQDGGPESAVVGAIVEDGVVDNASEYPDIETDYAGWLRGAKVRWKALREARRSGRRSLRNRTGLESYLHQQAAAILQNDWQIVQLSETDRLGEYRAWVLLADRAKASQNILSVEITVPRVFYVNSRVPYPEEDMMRRRGFAISRAVKVLPRGHPVHYLYEFTMSEIYYQEHLADFNTLFSHQAVEGVYETRMPLMTRALLYIRRTMNVTKACMQQRTQQLVRSGAGEKSEKSPLDQLRFNLVTDLRPSPSSARAPPALAMHICYVYWTKSAASAAASARGAVAPQLLGLFFPHLGRGHVVYVEARMRGRTREAESISSAVTQTLYAETLAEHRASARVDADDGDDGGAALDDHSGWVTHRETIDMTVDVVDNAAAAVKHISGLLSDYHKARRGPTLVVLTSPHSLKECLQRGFTSLHDFPTMEMPFHGDDRQLPALDWHRVGLRRMLTRYLAVNAWLTNCMTLSAYADVPPCNIPNTDQTLFISDLFLGRKLMATQHLSWYSPTAVPDLGGRQDHLVPEVFRAPVVSHPTQSAQISIELGIYNFSYNAVLQAQTIDAHEGIDSAADMTASATAAGAAAGSGPHQMLHSHRFGQGIQNDTLSRSVFAVFVELVKQWSREALQDGNAVAGACVARLERYLQNPLAGLFEPALGERVVGLMRRVFVQLLAEFAQFGARIVYAGFDRIILTTQKNDMMNAIGYGAYIVSSLASKPLFAHLDIGIERFYDYLIFKNIDNLCGVVATNHEALSKLLLSDPNFSKPRQAADDDADEASAPAAEFAIMTKFSMIQDLAPFVQTMFKRVFIELLYFVMNHRQQQRQAQQAQRAAVSQTASKDRHTITAALSIADRAANAAKELSAIKTFLLKTLKPGLMQAVDAKLREAEQLMHAYHVAKAKAEAAGHAYDGPVPARDAVLKCVVAIAEILRVYDETATAVKAIRRDCLSLLRVREFANEATWRPRPTFTLDGVLCDYCHFCRTLALADETHRIQQGLPLQPWVCSECDAPYELATIECQLLQALQQETLRFVTQDVICGNCKWVLAEDLRDACPKCSSDLTLGTTGTTLSDVVRLLHAVADQRGMPLLRMYTAQLQSPGSV